VFRVIGMMLRACRACWTSRHARVQSCRQGVHLVVLGRVYGHPQDRTLQESRLCVDSDVRSPVRKALHTHTHTQSAQEIPNEETDPFPPSRVASDLLLHGWPGVVGWQAGRQVAGWVCWQSASDQDQHGLAFTCHSRLGWLL
jgi:hypothetical protein